MPALPGQGSKTPWSTSQKASQKKKNALTKKKKAGWLASSPETTQSVVAFASGLLEDVEPDVRMAAMDVVQDMNPGDEEAMFFESPGLNGVSLFIFGCFLGFSGLLPR